MVFSEYKRRLISTHIYLSNVLLTKICIWDFKIRSTRNLLYAQVVILPIFVIVILQKTQLDLFRNKFVHINVITLKKQLQDLPRQSMSKILFDEMRTKARELLRITLI